MGMVVAKEFNVRPNEVFGEWESLEVLITFGILLNDVSKENWASYQASKKNAKPIIPKSEFAVTFKTLDMLEYDAKHQEEN